MESAGPFSPVNADLTLTLALPSGCSTSDPASVTTSANTLPVSATVMAPAPATISLELSDTDESKGTIEIVRTSDAPPPPPPSGPPPGTEPPIPPPLNAAAEGSRKTPAPPTST